MANKEQIFILGVNGSPRKDGRVAKMLEKVLKSAGKRGARVKTIHLVDYKILPHSGRLNQKVYVERTKDDMPYLQRLVLQADGIVFASPTHWFNVSSLMKLFLDRLTCLEDYKIGRHNVFLLEGKIAGFITYGPQAGAASAATILTMTANQMGMLIRPTGRSLMRADTPPTTAGLGKNMTCSAKIWFSMYKRRRNSSSIGDTPTKSMKFRRLNSYRKERAKGVID